MLLGFFSHLPFLTLEFTTPHMLVGYNTSVFFSLLLGKISSNCNYWCKTPNYFTDFSSFLVKQHLIDSESLFHFKWLIWEKNIYSFMAIIFIPFLTWKRNYVGKMQDQSLSIWRATRQQGNVQRVELSQIGRSCIFWISPGSFITMQSIASRESKFFLSDAEDRMSFIF